MINRDRNLRLQYLAGMSLNTYQAGAIYVNMTAHSRYPENLFSSSHQFLTPCAGRFTSRHPSLRPQENENVRRGFRF